MNDTIKLICEQFRVSPSDIAKKKRGEIREYTYHEILQRILEGSGSLQQTFPEFNKDTTAALLKKLFPGKTKVSQNWRTYLIECTGLKRCSKCGGIKSRDEFSVNAKEPDGLRAQCRPCAGESWKEHYNKYQEHHTARTKEYRLQHLEERTLYNKYYYQANKDLYDVHNAKRRATELNAAVVWANIDEIEAIYANCPPEHHVDHIVPLQGKTVCGLHVEHNLQYLPKVENLAKSNKFDPITYEHTTVYKPPYQP